MVKKQRVVKLSIGGLKAMIAEEKSRLGKIEDVQKVSKKTKEVEADELADTLEKDVDHYKGLKEHEALLLKKLKETRAKLKRSAIRINEARKRKGSK